MGVYTFLISDKKKQYFDLGKIFLDEYTLTSIREASGILGVKQEISECLQDDDYNVPMTPDEADDVASQIVTWMRSHPDWLFITDQDEKYEEIYLAKDQEDAEEYQEEFADDASPIYMKDGGVT